MKRKITISAAELALIAAALIEYRVPDLAAGLAKSFESADSTNDGPEVAILRRPYYMGQS